MRGRHFSRAARREGSSAAILLSSTISSARVRRRAYTADISKAYFFWQEESSLCSNGRSGHVFGLFARYSRPLAIMPSADQVPVKTSHSMMLWPMWVVLIAGSTGTALRAVRLSNRYVTPDVRRDSLRRERDRFPVALTPGHHGPRYPGDLVGKRDRRDLGRPPRQQC